LAIKPSSSQQIDRLVADLSGDEVAREAAVARLIVLGARAVERLIALGGSRAAPAARAAAFRALEAIADPHALECALGAIPDADPMVAVAAIAVARTFVRGPQSATIVDAVTVAVIDQRRSEPVRLAALRTLMDLERSTVEPLLKSLADDPSSAVRELVADRRKAPQKPSRVDPLVQLTQAAEQGLPDDPHVLHQAIAAAADTAPLPLLLAIVERVRDREGGEPQPRRMEWMMARAAAHVALANRGSRLALYDLREALDRADAPLPVEFLSALSVAGDASCLVPLAGAYVRSTRAGRLQRDWWRQHLRDTFRTIVKREKLTRRSALLKRIEKRWPTVLADMADG
jgi:HEAT repeat protein